MPRLNRSQGSGAGSSSNGSGNQSGSGAGDSGGGSGGQAGSGHGNAAEIQLMRVAGGSMNLLALQKLKGRENYVSWAFAMRMVMIREGTWRAVDPPEGTEVNQDLSDRALAAICLSIEPYNYSLVQRAKTAKEAWVSLRTAFQESGKHRKINLLRKLTRLELEDCSTVEEYVDEMMSTSHKLEEIGFKLDNEWMSLILLMGLPKRYEPMIMGLDVSGINLTVDVVKSKILQDVTLETGSSSGSASALVTQQSKPGKKKAKANIKCYKCERLGHYASECQQKPKTQQVKGGNKNKQAALLAFQSSACYEEDWILDSGAGRHMCRSEERLIGAKATSEAIFVANSTEIPVVAVGNVQLDADVEGTCTNLDVSDVLCVPELAINLLSVSGICKKGYRVTFTSKHCEVVHESTGEVIATGFEKDGLYKLNQRSRAAACVAELSSNLELWHRRLGHLNVDSIKQLPTMVTGVEVCVGTMPACVSCAEGKHRKLPFKPSGARASEVLELVHSDLCGPTEQASIGGSRYFITFIDDATRMTFAYFIKSKSEAFSVFEEFKAYVENQTGKKLKCLRTDNGKEYVNGHFEQFFKAHGIRHETTVPYNPQLNGLAERMNRTIEEKARCLLFDAGLDKSFWAEAASTAVYLTNRSPTKGSPLTPQEKFTGKKPNLSHLRVFGSKVMAYVPKPKRRKWDQKSIPCILVGYADCTKGYRVYNPASKQVFVSRDVIVLDEIKRKNEMSEEVPRDAETTTFTSGVNEAGESMPVVAGGMDVETSDSEDDGAQSADLQQPFALPPQPTQHSSNMRRSARERRLPGSSTDLAPSLLGYFDSLATKVSDDQSNGNSLVAHVATDNSESLNATAATVTITSNNASSTSISHQKILHVSETHQSSSSEKSFQSSLLKFKNVYHANGSGVGLPRPNKPGSHNPKVGDKFRFLSSNVQRILSNTETAVDAELIESSRPRLPLAPFHRNHPQTASATRHTLKHLPLSRNITKFSQVTNSELIEQFSSTPETGNERRRDSNGNCDTSIEEDVPKLSFIQQRIKSLTSALVGDDDDVEPKTHDEKEDPEDQELVLRNPQKSMATSQQPAAGEPQDAFVENCDESEHRNTIVEARNPYLSLVVVEPSGDSDNGDLEDRRKLTYARVQLPTPSRPRTLKGSPKLPRVGSGGGLQTPPKTFTSTPSLDTSSSTSLSSSKTSLTQTPGTPVLSTRPLSASSICSYSSSSSSGSDNLLLGNGKCCGAPSYQASVESLADQSECEQNGSTIGLTMCERAVMEIIDSERSYVEDLGQIIKGYLQDWKERACLKVDELEVLFSNIQEIWEFNIRMLARLNETKGNPVKISGCFIELHEDFTCYTTYCTRYPEAIALLTSLLQATHTNALLIQTQKMLNHTLPLGSYLLKPVQRILKYHLLLDNLRKHCDDKQVAHAHELMKNVAHNIDQVKKKLEQQSRVKELAGILDGWLGPDLSVLGELRQEGVLDEHTKHRVVLLFRTMLIITKPKEDKRLQFRAYIPCKNLMLVEHLPGEPTSFNVIPYNDPKGQIRLTARSRDQKRLWTQQIKQAMLEHFDIPKRARELVLQLGDDDDRINDKNASWKWPTNHPSTPDYLERRQQFRRSEMRQRSKKMRKNASSSISLDGISPKDVKQPTFQSYSKSLEQADEVAAEEAETCKCDAVKKELEQKQIKNRSRSETRLQEEKKGTKMSDEEIFAKAMHERNRFATQGRRKTKESFTDVKSYNTTTIPKRIANMRKTRSKTLTGNSTFYTDLGMGEASDDTTVLKITESTDNLSLGSDSVCRVDEQESIGKDAVDEEGSPKKDSDIISQLVLEKSEFKKMKPPKKKSFDSRSLSCASQDEDTGVEQKEDEQIPQPPSTEPPDEGLEEDEFRKVDELNKNSEDLLNRLSEIQSDLPSPEPIYESLMRNVHVPYKYVPPLTRSVSQQYGKALESLRENALPKKSRPESDYVTLAYSENGLVNIDGHCVVPKTTVAQLRNSDTNINYHHPWRKEEDLGTVQDTRSEIVNLTCEELVKPLERQGSLSIKSPKNLLQRFISLHSSPSTGSCDSNLHQRKISYPDDSTPIYKQGSLDLGSRIANLDYADPRTLFTNQHSPFSHQPNILINRASMKSFSADLEQRDSIFSLTSSSDSVCGAPTEQEDESCGFYEKSVEECLENDDFRDSAVYSGDDNDRRPDLDEQVVYESIGEVGQYRLLSPPSHVTRSSSSASSSSSGPPPIPAKPAHLEQRKVVQMKVRPLSVIPPSVEPRPAGPAPKGWVLQQVKRFQ